MGGVHLAMGHTTRALALYEEQLTLAQELDNTGLKFGALLSLAATQQTLGSHTDALHSYQVLQNNFILLLTNPVFC